MKKRETTDSHDMVGEKLVKKRETTDSHDMVREKLVKTRETTDSHDMVEEKTCEKKCEDIKWVIRSRKLKKDRQFNDPNKKRQKDKQ